MNNKPKTKNDKAWERLFNKYGIINRIERDGYFQITSKQINEFREARLMTKFDHKSNLPQLFEKNKLSILPITRGSYMISQFDAYHKMEKRNHKIEKINFPDYIQSIDYGNITSEAAAINTAYISGIFADFMGDEELLPTVSGRMSSNAFSFDIKNLVNGKMSSIKVLNSQIEIDGGYEGIDSLCIIEAKNSVSDDFLIRQLYYPFRLWNKRINKPIRPIFLIYSNGIFSLYEYRFMQTNNYNSLSLIKQKNYSIEPDDITFDDVDKILKNVNRVPEPTNIPFPQANSFIRVINLCELLYENEVLTRDEITYRYDFDSRQTNYYTDACRYLGLIDKKTEQKIIKYYLTEKGNKLFALNIKIRNLKFIELILEHKPFYLTLKKYFSLSEMPCKDEIVEIMKESNVLNVKKDSTFSRRSSTISGWINWILDLTR